MGVVATTLALGTAPVRAQPARAVGPTPPRLAFVDGEVSFWRPGADDWAPAQINTPLAAGDTLYVGDSGNAEIEIGSGAYIRAGAGTQLALASLETGYLQLEVTSGHAAVDLARLPEGQEIEVDSPSGAFTINRSGYYRVDVDDDTTFTVRNGGAASVVPGGGEAQDIGADHRAVLHGTDQATVSVEGAPPPDEWDRWNADRGGRRPAKPRGAQYVPPPVSGIDDLDAAGDWDDTPDYGHVWVPRDVPDDWAPYSNGRWTWDPYYDWTWVDYEPWGWAPYHYGRWCRWHDRWAWAPGPIIAAPVYSPALVTFFGGGGVSVGIGIGAPVVSWVALGWGEPILPWWGPVGFHGRPYWGGWGGPRVVNNVVINNTTIVNARDINHFSNVGVRNAVIGSPRDRFGRGAEHVRIAEDQARQLQPLRGSVGVRPVAASLMPKEGKAQRPPERIQARRVVATRPPQDPTSRLRAAGIQTRAPVQRPEARIVTPKRGAAERHENAQPGGQPEQHDNRPEKGNRPEHGNRMVAPPPPGRENAPGNAERGRGAEGNPAAGAPGRNQQREEHRATPPPGERGHMTAPGNQPNEHGATERGGRNAGRPQQESPPPPPQQQQERRDRSHGRNAEPPAPPHERAVEPSAPRPERQERATPPQHEQHERVAPQHGQHERVAPQSQPERVAPPPPDQSRGRSMEHQERSQRQERQERPQPQGMAPQPERAPPPQRERVERPQQPVRERDVQHAPAHERNVVERPPAQPRKAERAAPQPPPPPPQHQAPKPHGHANEKGDDR